MVKTEKEIREKLNSKPFSKFLRELSVDFAGHNYKGVKKALEWVLEK